MIIYILELHSEDWNDTFYFNNPPTLEDVLKELKKNEKLTGEEYTFLYERFMGMARKLYSDPYWHPMTQLGSKGGPIGERNSSNSFGDIILIYDWYRSSCVKVISNERPKND